jgi:hypothetical protein
MVLLLESKHTFIRCNKNHISRFTHIGLKLHHVQIMHYDGDLDPCSYSDSASCLFAPSAPPVACWPLTAPFGLPATHGSDYAPAAEPDRSSLG